MTEEQEDIEADKNFLISREKFLNGVYNNTPKESEFNNKKYYEALNLRHDIRIKKGNNHYE